MTKKILSFVLAMTLIVSLFAGLTVTASADYEGTGTFVKTTGSLDSAYYVFTYATATTMFPMSNDTSANNWIKPGPSFTITDTLENPDPSIVWYYDADAGTLNSAGDPTLYVSWPTTGKSAMPTTTATPVTITDTGSGVYNITVTAAPEHMLRYNTQSSGWRFYETTNGTVGDTIVFKLSDSSAPVHEHVWGEWSSNDDGTHTRTCAGEDCPIGSQTENCSFDEGTVTTQPTCADEGVKHFTCIVCGYEKDEAVPATGEHVDANNDGACDVCGEEMPTDIVFTLGTELHEGDQVVIYSVNGKLALSVNASGSKLTGTAVSIEGVDLTVMSNDLNTAVMTVEFVDAQNFLLKTADGKYLTTGATGNSLSFADAATDYSQWYLSLADSSTVFIKNTNAKYNNRIQALEFYKNLFTAYSESTGAAYQFQLYIHANQSAHVHDWTGAVTTEPTCTAKGVMTYSCSGCDETYTEDIPMIPHADGDGDGLCDACEGKIYSQAETLNDGDSLILVTGAFGVALTGTETSNGGYMAAVEINAQEGVTVPVADDNVWTVKTAEGGFYLVNSEGQYLCVNESNKLALGDEWSDNNIWTIGESVEGLEPTGAYLYNPGAERYLEYGKNYNNYQTYTAPTENYETWYAFTFFTCPAEPTGEASFTMSPTEVTLEGFNENGDLLLPFTAETLTFGPVQAEGRTFMPNYLHVEFYSGTLSNGTDDISFQIYEGNLDEHWGTGESYGFDFDEQGEEEFILLFIEPSALSAAAPGVYTGTMRYTSKWLDETDAEADGPSGTVELTLVIPEPEPMDDGYYLLIAHGDDDWVIGSVDPANKFEPNGNAQDEWMLNTTLAVEDQIKVVRVENNAITGWWPNGEHTQYHVDEAHSGNVTIYFKTDYVDAWREFGGYFYIGSLLKPDTYADVYGCSISLKGNIALNFYVIPSEELIADPKAYVMLGETKLLFSEATTRTVGEDTLYQFTLSLHAKQMNDVVTLRVYDGEDNLVALYRHSNDEDVTETGYSYSVQTYIQTVRETSSDAKLIALVNAMSDYGSLAQAQFGYNTDSRAEVQADLSGVTAENLESFQAVKTEGTATGVSYYGTSLLLQSETVMRIYFTLDEGEIGDYTFKLGSKKVTPVQSDGKWYVEIANISAKDLDKTYTLTVSSAEGKIVTVKASALSYAYTVLNGGSNEATLIELVKGLYLYNQAANAYFGK